MKAACLYSAAGIVLLIGLVTLFRRGFVSRGLDAIAEFGPLLFVIPMAVFGTFHFLFLTDVAGLVPKWIPGHLFWACFCGAALIAAAISIAANKLTGLSAALLGLMLLLFVLLISVPGVAARPANRFGWALLLRDLSFSSAAFALAISRWHRSGRAVGFLIALLRSLMAIAMLFFAVQHFRHPEFVPVLPLPQPLPSWFPVHALVNYVVGSAELVAGVCLLFNVRTRMAATLIGTVVLVVVVIVYLPLLIATPSQVAQVNYFFDTLAYGGGLLLMTHLAGRPKTADPLPRTPDSHVISGN
jgi:uncharacterized membrane protein